MERIALTDAANCLSRDGAATARDNAARCPTLAAQNACTEQPIRADARRILKSTDCVEWKPCERKYTLMRLECLLCMWWMQAVLHVCVVCVSVGTTYIDLFAFPFDLYDRRVYEWTHLSVSMVIHSRIVSRSTARPPHEIRGTFFRIFFSSLFFSLERMYYLLLVFSFRRTHFDRSQLSGTRRRCSDDTFSGLFTFTRELDHHRPSEIFIRKLTASMVMLAVFIDSERPFTDISIAVRDYTRVTRNWVLIRQYRSHTALDLLAIQSQPVSGYWLESNWCTVACTMHADCTRIRSALDGIYFWIQKQWDFEREKWKIPRMFASHFDLTGFPSEIRSNARINECIINYISQCPDWWTWVQHVCFLPSIRCTSLSYSVLIGMCITRKWSEFFVIIT